jgi:hypothetical protein
MGEKIDLALLDGPRLQMMTWELQKKGSVEIAQPGMKIFKG